MGVMEEICIVTVVNRYDVLLKKLNNYKQNFIYLYKCKIQRISGFAVKYIGDILVFSNTFEEYKHHLR